MVYTSAKGRIRYDCSVGFSSVFARFGLMFSAIVFIETPNPVGKIPVASIAMIIPCISAGMKLPGGPSFIKIDDKRDVKIKTTTTNDINNCTIDAFQVNRHPLSNPLIHKTSRQITNKYIQNPIAPPINQLTKK